MSSSALRPRAEAEQLDAADQLARFREEFHIPKRIDGHDCTYLCGHSLGLAPRAAATLIAEELQAWASLGVDAHFESARPWVSYHEQVTEGLAQLAGAGRAEVVAMNSLTVNLHLLLVSFYRPEGQRRKILMEAAAFSSDRYALQSHLRFHGYDPATTLIELHPRPGENNLRTEDTCATIEREGAQIALVLLPGVQYLSGQRFDMAAITRTAHDQGCLVGWDLAHAIGNIPLRLHAWDVDFAVWCSYKYLNGGPGAIGGAFVHERHGYQFDLPRFGGWWAHEPETRFAMTPEFHPAAGARGWQVSNPPILSTTPLIASLRLFTAAGITALQSKSQRLTDYLQSLLQEACDDRLTIITPASRGAQLSVCIKGGRQRARSIFERLLAAGIVVDWREPDIIRVAPVALYNRFSDVWDFAAIMHSLLNGAESKIKSPGT